MVGNQSRNTVFFIQIRNLPFFLFPTDFFLRKIVLQLALLTHIHIKQLKRNAAPPKGRR